MTALVTGGTGVVGTAVVQQLVADGRTVRCLVRSDASAEKVSALGAEPVRGDVTDSDSVDTAMVGSSVVFHVAGVVEFCSREPDRMWSVNVDGTRTVIDAATRHGVERVVHTSSTVTLGERAGTVGSESTVHRGRSLTKYEASKSAAESIALGAAGVDVVAVNPSSVQGPGRSTGTGRILLDAVNGDLPFMVDTSFSIVDVDDCAKGHLLAELHGVPGERYVLSGFTLTAREAVDLLSALTGQTSPVRIIPTWMLALLGPFADLIGRYVDSVPVCSESLRQMRSGARYDGSRATRELGLEYRSAEETFARVLEWFRSEGLTDR